MNNQQEKDSFKTLECHKTAHPSTTTGLDQRSRAKPLFRTDFEGTVRKKMLIIKSTKFRIFGENNYGKMVKGAEEIA